MISNPNTGKAMNAGKDKQNSARKMRYTLKRLKLSSRYPATGRNSTVATLMAVSTMPILEPVMPISSQ